MTLTVARSGDLPPWFLVRICRHAMQESAGRLFTESERSMRSADAGPGGGHSWFQSVTPVDAINFKRLAHHMHRSSKLMGQLSVSDPAPHGDTLWTPVMYRRRGVDYWPCPPACHLKNTRRRLNRRRRYRCRQVTAATRAIRIMTAVYRDRAVRLPATDTANIIFIFIHRKVVK